MGIGLAYRESPSVAGGNEDSMKSRDKVETMDVGIVTREEDRGERPMTSFGPLGSIVLEIHLTSGLPS